MKLEPPESITGNYKYVCAGGKLTTEHRAKMKKACPQESEDKLVIHHIDGNKGNNDIENLVWMTRREHIQLHKTGVKRPCISGTKNPNYKRGEWVGGEKPKWYKKEYNKRYYHENRERLLSRQKEYDALHRERNRLYGRMRYWNAALGSAKTEKRRQECLTHLAELKEVIL